MINDSPYLSWASIFYSFRGSSTNYYFPLDFTVGGAVASFGRRLEWPDDFFRVMWSAKYMQKEYEGSPRKILIIILVDFKKHEASVFHKFFQETVEIEQNFLQMALLLF